MINYEIVEHPSGKFRIKRNLNGVTSYVNKNKKYFRYFTDVDKFIDELMRKDKLKFALMKSLRGRIKAQNFPQRVNI